MQTVIDKLVAFGTEYGLKVIGAVVILIAGRIVAGLVRKVIGTILEKAKADHSIVSFASNLAFFAVIVFAVISALGKFGVETTSFVAVIGAAGLAVGFALQGSLSNFAAGVLILVFRPFKVGDIVTAAGISGTIKEIQIFNTILATPDNIKITVPNGKIYGDVIQTVTAFDTRRIDITVGVGNGSLMQKAEDILQKLVREEGRVLREPAPEVAVAELAGGGVNFVVRPWVKKADYWPVRVALNKKIREAFNANGL